MKYLFAIVMLLPVNSAHGLDWQGSPEVKKLFNDAGMQGTFVLYDVAEDRFTGMIALVPKPAMFRHPLLKFQLIT